MHEWLDEMMESIARADLGKPDSNEATSTHDAGFYHDYHVAFYTWLHHKSHGTLPEPGGLFDQDWQLVFDDWGVLNRKYNEQVFALRDDDESGDLLDMVDEKPRELDDFL
jgi:hypothetical protein